MALCSICRTKDINKLKTYEQNKQATKAYSYISLVQVSSHQETKMEKTRFKRMSILQLDPEGDINESETKI